MLRDNHLLAFAAVLFALAIAAGAFGAHYLKTIIPPDKLIVYKTASDYHFYHAIGFFILGLIQMQLPSLTASLDRVAILMGLGLLLFSGSLYLLAITQVRFIGIITPIGGLSLIAAWSYLAIVLVKNS